MLEPALSTFPSEHLKPKVQPSKGDNQSREAEGQRQIKGDQSHMAPPPHPAQHGVS